MRSASLRLYHSLPPFARQIAASIRGHQLWRWRYGPDTDRMTKETLARDYWTTQQWDEWYQERKHEFLSRAKTHVPYYRECWAGNVKCGDDQAWQSLQNWPVLEKEVLRCRPHDFLAEDCNKTRLARTNTSGSTGTPLTLWNKREDEQFWYSLFEARCRHWYGVSRHDRWAILGGQLVAPVSSRKPPFWTWNAGLSQLYMSTYHLAPDLMPLYLDALVRYRVRYLLGYPSALYLLALGAIEARREDFDLQVVIANAEPLYHYQRSTISEAFRCPVRETYGMSERVAAASECEHGSLHLWPEAGLIEILEGHSTLAPGQVGDLVATGLVNTAMPLIRYRVGDRVALDPETTPCACGRTLPRIARIEGRSDDMLCTADGRRIGRLDPVFKSGWPIREAQLIQESLDTIRVRLVPSDGFDHSIEREVTAQLRARLGDVHVEFEKLSEIPRGANGKFRAVISKVNTSSHDNPPSTQAV